MATYAELTDLYRSEPLRDKAFAAVMVAADGVRSDGSPPANQANRLAWALRVSKDPRGEALKTLAMVLALNKDVPAANIEAATDAAIQTNVDAVVDFFADNDS